MCVRPVKSRFSSRGCRVFLVALGLATHATLVVGQDDPAAVPVIVATGSGPLSTRIEVQTLVEREGPDGEIVRQFVEAGRLEAGEQLYYTIRVTNPGQEPVNDVIVTKQLPYGVDYVPGSAAGPGCRIELSLDGGVAFERSKRQGGIVHARAMDPRPAARARGNGAAAVPRSLPLT